MEYPSNVNLLSYAVGKLLGKGGSSRVYRAINTLTTEPAALKVFSNTVSGTKTYENELTAYTRLNNYSNGCNAVLRLYGHGKTNESVFYLALEFSHYPALSAHLKSGPLPEGVAIYALAQLLDALVFLQSHRLVHRDVKPDNLLFDAESKQIKLIDLGLASLSVDAESADYIQRGTPIYMSPQVLKRTWPVSLVKADVWSAGITYWEMLLGFCPFFKCKSMSELQTRHCHLDFTTLPPCSRFLLEQGLLQLLESKRWTPAEALDIVLGA